MRRHDDAAVASSSALEQPAARESSAHSEPPDVHRSVHERARSQRQPLGRASFARVRRVAPRHLAARDGSERLPIRAQRGHTLHHQRTAAKKSNRSTCVGNLPKPASHQSCSMPPLSDELAPLAQVQHSSAQSRRRRRGRAEGTAPPAHCNATLPQSRRRPGLRRGQGARTEAQRRREPPPRRAAPASPHLGQRPRLAPKACVRWAPAHAAPPHPGSGCACRATPQASPATRAALWPAPCPGSLLRCRRPPGAPPRSAAAAPRPPPAAERARPPHAAPSPAKTPQLNYVKAPRVERCSRCRLAGAAAAVRAWSRLACEAATRLERFSFQSSSCCT